MRKTKSDAEATKLKILESALDIFSDKGYDGTSISDICKKAQITKGALYWHFESKQALYTYLIKSIFDEIIERSHELDSYEDQPLIALRNFTKNFLNEIAENETYQTALKLFVREFKLDTSDSFSDLIEDLQKSFDLAYIFEQSIKSKNLTDILTAEEYSTLYNSLLDNCIINWLWSTEDFDLVERGIKNFNYIFRLDLNKEKK